MLHTDAKSLVERGDRLFSKKAPFDTRNQHIAEQFYVERADFTTNLQEFDEYAGHLVSGYPLAVRRDLGNSFGSMTRPKGKQWFRVRTSAPEREDHAAKQWLDFATGVMTRAIYDPVSMFTRATKEADHDFSAFGGAAVSVEMNRRDTALLYRCWHLRDMAWEEDSYGQLCAIHRNWKPTVSEACSYFAGSEHPNWETLKKNDPHQTVTVRHVIIRADEYDRDKKQRQKWVSLYVDVENQHVLKEAPSTTRHYVLPRWATVSGSQYPYSPAAVIALPHARLLQAMTATLLDAGERIANPPMIGVSEAVRGDINLYPGGFTSVDSRYDERLGEVLRPLSVDAKGMPLTLDMADRNSEMLREVFYLNTLSMPPHGNPEMTSYEVGQRVQEYIRQALPLFEPLEAEYNHAICDMTFETLMLNGGFGSPSTIPESIRGLDTEYEFESPLADMREREKGSTFLEAKAMISEAAAIDPSAVQIMDFGKTLRDVLMGIGTPAGWLNSPEHVAQKRQEEEELARAGQLAGVAQQGAGAVSELTQAAQAFRPAA